MMKPSRSTVWIIQTLNSNIFSIALNSIFFTPPSCWSVKSTNNEILNSHLRSNNSPLFNRFMVYGTTYLCMLAGIVHFFDTVIHLLWFPCNKWGHLIQVTFHVICSFVNPLLQLVCLWCLLEDQMTEEQIKLDDNILCGV